MTAFIAIFAFINAAGMNWFYSKSIQAVGKHDRFMAANWTAGICACGIITTLVVVRQDMFGIAGALLGAWIGTFVSVKPGVEPAGGPTMPSRSKAFIRSLFP
jgi:hypothetical protein